MRSLETKPQWALPLSLTAALACTASPEPTSERDDGAPDHPSGHHDEGDSGDDGSGDDGNGDDEEADGLYEVNNLVSDQEGVAEHVDPHLINAWGLAFGPDTFFWVANAGSSTSTLYDGDGVSHSDAIGGPLVIPGVMPDPNADEDEEGETPGPTGLVFYGGGGFEVEPGAPSRFIFATTGGTLVGWSPMATDPRLAVAMVDNSMAGASYTGLAIATFGGLTQIYAANFAMGTIDVYDESFAPATGLGPDAFVDPELPEGYSPFGIHTLGDRIYVAYAKQEEGSDEEETGLGLGIVSAFALDGSCVAHVATGGLLDAPWGITLAPEEFGQFGGALLVGNFGDGHITAFDPESYEELGQLESAPGQPLAIDGLWALAFGNDNMAGDADDLYFTAGPGEELHGLFGEIEVADEAKCGKDDEGEDDDHRE